MKPRSILLIILFRLPFCIFLLCLTIVLYDTHIIQGLEISSQFHFKRIKVIIMLFLEIQLLMGKDLPEGINPSYKTFGYGGFFRYTLLFVVIHHVALFLIESLTLFDPLFLAIRIAASVVTTTLLICTIEAFNIGSQKSGD